jgi:hypothetical protein
MEIITELFIQVILGIAIIVIGTAIVIFAKFIRKNIDEDNKTDEYLEAVGENLIDKGETMIFQDEDSSVAIPKKELTPMRPVGRPKKEQNND